MSHWALLTLIGFFTNLFFFQRFSTALVTPEGAHARTVGDSGAGGRRTRDRRHGAVRLGAHQRPRYSGSDRGDPDQRQPHRSEGRAAQAAVVSHLDRIRRAVRRRRTDHHDRRRGRVADRAVLPPDQRRAQDAPGRRRGRRHVGDICGAARGGAPGGRAPALRVEASQPDSRRARQRHGGGDAPLHHRTGTALPGAGASGVHRAARPARLRAGRPARRRIVCGAHASGVRGGRRLSAPPDPLDVVAGDWRSRDRRRRLDVSPGARRRL